MRDDGYGGDFKTFEPIALKQVVKLGHAETEGDEDGGRWCSETYPCEQAAEEAASGYANSDADLAASWARQEVAERNEVGEAALREPVSVYDVLLMEESDVGDGAAEGCEAEA